MLDIGIMWLVDDGELYFNIISHSYYRQVVCTFEAPEVKLLCVISL